MRHVEKQESSCNPATLSKEKAPILVFSNEFLEVFQGTFFAVLLRRLLLEDNSLLLFITNFKRRPTVLLTPLLLIWNMIFYAKIEESHSEYCFLF